MHDITLRAITSADCVEADAVRGWLREFNLAENGTYMQLRELPENDPQPLQLFAYSNGEIVGGLLGETQFKWLKVAIMAINPQHRARGIGTMLLAEAERIANSRGCSYSFLDTMSYQAPEFYLKCGYKLSGQLPDWDSHGHSKLFFAKSLI